MAENPYKKFDREAHAVRLVDGMDGPAADMAALSPDVTNPYQRFAARQVNDRPGEHVLPPPESPSIPSQIGRGVALTGRALFEGVNALPQAAQDLGVAARNVTESAVNRFAPGLGQRVYGINRSIAGAVPEGMARDVVSAALPQDAPAGAYESASSLGRQSLNALGLPEASTPAERIASGMTTAVTGAGISTAAGRGLAQAADPVSRGLGQVLAANPVAQGTAAATGAASSGFAREAGAGPVSQMAAGLAGSLAPTAGAGLVRGVMRGGEAGRQELQRSIDDFGAAGTSPSVGQGTGRRAMQATETAIGSSPGGGGVLAKVAENTQKKIGARVRELADNTGGLPDANQAGRTIESGVKGFIARMRAKSGALYGELDNKIPGDSQMDIGNARKVLDEVTAPISGAENTSKLLANPRLREIREAFEADLQGGVGSTLPYSAIKGIRSRIGRMLTQSELISDIPRAELKRLYGALSDDMAKHAQAIDRINGNTAATAAFARANSYYKAGLNRLEDQLRYVSGKIERAGASPEEIFSAVERNATDSGSRLLSLRRTLKPEEWDHVVSTVVQRMGRANPSAQDAAGDVFSSERFLTSWNKLTPQAKQALFGGERYRGLEANLSKVAETAERIREGSRVLANPSGTGNRLTNAGAILFALGGLATGNWKPAAGVAAATVSTDVAARLMTSPQFVGWLARTTSVPGGGAQQMNLALSSLQYVADADPNAGEDVNEYVGALARTAESNQTGAE